MSDEGKTRMEVARGFTRHWRGSNWREVGAAEADRPYRGAVHDLETDGPVEYRERLRELLSALPEGSLVTLVLEVGEDLHPPAWEDPWVLLRPHEYGPLSKDEGEEES